MYSTAGFKPESIRVSQFDAENFMRALDSGLVVDRGGGRYRCEKSSANEQIFWTGSKSVKPRPLTLWIEPVITIGTIARLGLDYEWPKETLCMQSKDWAFDFAIIKGNDKEDEHIVGEVKKTEKEIDNLIDHMEEYGRTGMTDGLSLPSNETNSFRKWKSLLRSKPPLFWAVGPNDYTHLFFVDYQSDARASFSKIELDNLAVS